MYADAQYPAAAHGNGPAHYHANRNRIIDVTRVSMKMGNARTVRRRVSDPYFMPWFEIGCKDKNLITFAG